MIRELLGLGHAPVAEPVAVAVSNIGTKEELAQYTAQARRIGLLSPALLHLQLLHYLKDAEIPVYDYKKVDTYLRSKFGDVGYVWRPLRLVDRIPGRDWIETGGIAQEVYTKPVPFPVLKTVEDISTAVPGVHFYISDERYQHEIYRDPFLMVAAPGGERVVVERWDEPSFRG